MSWVIITIIVLLGITVFWLILEYRKEQQKEKQVFDEYFKRRRKLKFKR